MKYQLLLTRSAEKDQRRISNASFRHFKILRETLISIPRQRHFKVGQTIDATAWAGTEFYIQ